MLQWFKKRSIFAEWAICDLNFCENIGDTSFLPSNLMICLAYIYESERLQHKNYGNFMDSQKFRFRKKILVQSNIKSCRL